MDNRKIIITSDSTTDLSAELKERYGIKIIPLGVTLGDKVYRDGVDINPDLIYEYYNENKVLPKTSAANFAETLDFLTPFTEKGYEIVHFTISSEMSTTYHNACLAAEELEGVYVVDTKNLSTGGGLLVIAAAEMAEKGMSAKEIAEQCKALSANVDASFVIDNLEYLHKGGRCSAVAALGANLLKLKPCIVVKNGKMGVSKKYKGRFSEVLKTYAAERLSTPDDIYLDHVFVTHAGCDETIVNDIADIVRNTLPFKEVHITRAGCTISSHCGANTLGVLFIRKSPIE